MDNQTLWMVSWAVGAVVVLIVAVLLIAILATARRIEKTAGNIWVAGKQIAGNTVSIWLLAETNAHLEKALEATGGIGRSVASIDEALARMSRGRP